MNNILTQVFLLSRWVRAIEIASSMDLLGWYAHWSGSRVSGMMELICSITSLSKHFMITDVSATWNRNDDGLLKTYGDFRLGQGEFENGHEYACQLFCACSENAPRNTSALDRASVELIKDPTHICEIIQSSRLVRVLTPGRVLLLSKNA